MTTLKSSNKKTQGFYLRGFISLFLVSSVLAEFVSGLVLYVAPSGRVAQTTNWELLWLGKTQWEAMHTVFSFLWVVPLGLHLFFNWKPILSYLKDRATKAYTLKRELLAALALTGFFTLASVYDWTPVREVMAFGEGFSSFWENRGRSAGYFLPEEESLHPEATTPAAQAEAKVSSQAGTSQAPAEPASSTRRGYGKYTVQSLAEESGVSLPLALERLGQQGISAKGQESLLALSGTSGKLPSELAAIILDQPSPEQ